MDGEERNRRRDVGLFLLLLALAVATRVVLFDRMVVVSKDALDFVGMARNLSRGDVSAMLAHYQHPLYPFLIVVAHYATDDLILAGQVASLVASVAALLPFYLLVRRVFGSSIAVTAGLLFIFLPRFATLSADVVTEPTYVALCLAGLYCGYRAAADDATGSAALLGLFGGLAYLTRPEGGAVFLLGAAAIALAHFPRYSGRVVSKLRCLALAMAVFVAIAGPYLLYLRADTGGWHLSKKKSLAVLLNPPKPLKTPPNREERLTEGDDAADTSRSAPDPRSTRSVGADAQAHIPQSTQPPLGAQDLPEDFPGKIMRRPYSFAVREVFENAVQAGYPVLLALAIIGVIRPPKRHPGEIYLALAMALGLASVFLLARTMGYASSRHLLLFGILALPWAVRGIHVLAGLAAGRRTEEKARIRRSAFALRLILIAVLIVLSFRAFRLRRDEIAGHREAGLKILETFGPGRRFLYFRDGRAALYARGEGKDLEYSGMRLIEVLIMHAAKRSYDFLIVDREEFDEFIEDFESKVSKHPLEPVVRLSKKPGARDDNIVIYRFPHVPASRPKADDA